MLIPETLKRRLKQFCSDLRCPAPHVIRVSLTAEQISEFNLPTRPTKRVGNRHANKFEGDSVELDALPSAELRRLVRASIEEHISPSRLRSLRATEDSERDLLTEWARGIGGAA